MAGLSYDALLQRAKKALPDALSSGERFQIPEADIVVEGKTTILRNFLDIAEAIRRDPTMVLTYLLRELGTAGAQDGRRVVFKGKGTAAQVADRVKSYVDTYVMCQECGRPDTRLVKEDRVAMLECDACGARRPVKSVQKGAIVKVHIEKIAGTVAFGRISLE